MTLITSTTNTKKPSPIDCNGVLLTNVQCHMVPISILWYREYWTIQLRCTLETRQWTPTVSNRPIHQHGHTNFWYVCLLERLYFDYYNKWSTWARTKVVRRKHIIQPTDDMNLIKQATRLLYFMTIHVIIPSSGHGKSQPGERYLKHVYKLCNLLQFKQDVSYIYVALIIMAVLLKRYLPTQRHLVTFPPPTQIIFWE